MLGMVITCYIRDECCLDYLDQNYLYVVQYYIQHAVFAYSHNSLLYIILILHVLKIVSDQSFPPKTSCCIHVFKLQTGK